MASRSVRSVRFRSRAPRAPDTRRRHRDTRVRTSTRGPADATQVRTRLPRGARARLDAIVVRRGDTLGSDLLLETIRESSPAETWWAWAILSPIGPIPLGEEPGHSINDALVDRDHATRLRVWALGRGLLDQHDLQPWTTVGQVLAALESASVEARHGTYDWQAAMSALADGDTPDLRRRIEWLRDDGG